MQASRASKWNKADHAIMQRRAQEDHESHYGNYVREIQAIARVATWHETNQKYAVQKKNHANDLAINAELQQANEELKILRHKRLKELYTNEWQAYEAELNEQGLAILKDRD